ncbi:hypothetical protein BBJ28_00015048 [Nothophytophthora sp. Chile5]|nr:hypothetical protein BBJ28_00015048 [Nothophytophthora sp. Chile5]
MLLAETWPHIVGYDISGVVVACGDGVEKFAVGDEVFGMLPHDNNGALAEYVAVREDYISKKPANLTHVEAAALPLVSQTALQSFRLGQLAENKKVLITGGYEHRLNKKACSWLRVMGCGDVDSLVLLFCASRAGGAGSVAIQIAKGVFKAKQCFECITRGGAVVSISETPTWKSFSSGGESQGLSVSYFLGAILDCLSSPVTRRARQAQISYDFLFMVADGAIMDEVRQLAEQRVLTPVVDKVFPFEKADTALEYLEAGHAMGKVVVQLDETSTA